MGGLARIRISPDGSVNLDEIILRGVAIYEIKVFEDINNVIVGDGSFQWPIPEELDGSVLVAVEAGVSTVSSSGAVQVQLRKFEIGSGDMLTTKLTIDANERNSKDSGTQAVIDTTNDDVSWGGWISIDIDAAGVGAKGLTLKLAFAPSTLASITIKGAKGDAGGVVNWSGQWSGSTTYVINDGVNNGGTSYIAIAGSTNIEPGVTSGWESYWMVLAGGQQISELVCVISGNQYRLSTGVKLYVPVYFDCTIVEATLLADVVGDTVIELWKDTYGNYPPTSADKITASAPLTLSSAIKTTDTALTGWTTAISAGDVLAVNIVSVSTISLLTLSLKVIRS